MPVNFITRRTGSINYYYRESTPADVRAHLQRLGERAPAEVWVSLRTPDRREAIALLASVRAEQHRKWDEVRALRKASGGLPSLRDLEEAAADYVHERFIEVQRRVLRERITAGVDPSDEARRRRAKIAQVELMPSSSDIESMELLAGAVCRRKGWDLGAHGGQWEQLVQLVTKAVQYARGHIVETLEGRAPDRDRAAVLTRLSANAVPKARSGETLMELFERYEIDAKREGKSIDTLNTERKVLQHFAKFVGADRSVGSIARTDVREFKRALADVPTRWTAHRDLKGLDLARAAETWRVTGGATRSIRTVNRELSAVSAFYAWLIGNAYVDENIVNGFLAKIDKTKGKYPPYSYDQLQKVFATPLFASCDSANEHLPGEEQVRDWRYWIPLCALYSGARAGEIAQLLCTDVRSEEGVWVFDFNEEADKSLKTRSSRRIVPVHSALVRLGFIDYVHALSERGTASLFPQLEPGTRDDMSYYPSRFWQGYLKKAGLKERGLALHSFRHTFADECRRRGVDGHVLQALLGHADHSMTGHYGTLPPGTLEQRRVAIESLTFGGLHSSAPPHDESNLDR
jgi:integrase